MDNQNPELIFDLGHSLGHGGQADVYLLRLRATGSVYAGKFLREAWDPIARDAFVKEAQRQARVAGEYVVRIVTWNFEAAKPFVVMEYMPRGSLAEEIGRRAGFTAMEGVQAARTIAIGLADLHSRNVVHRDLKPGNVLVASDGRLLLSDLGLAATMTFSDYVQARGFVGTPGYAAPEQYQGLALPQSDVFALGIMLREMIMSRPEGATTALGARALLLADRLAAKEWRARPSAREAVTLLVQLAPHGSTAPVARTPPPPATNFQVQRAPTPSGGGGAGLFAGILGGLALAGVAALLSGGSSTWDPEVGRYRGSDGKFKSG